MNFSHSKRFFLQKNSARSARSSFFAFYIVNVWFGPLNFGCKPPAPWCDKSSQRSAKLIAIKVQSFPVRFQHQADDRWMKIWNMVPKSYVQVHSNPPASYSWSSCCIHHISPFLLLWNKCANHDAQVWTGERKRWSVGDQYRLVTSQTVHPAHSKQLVPCLHRTPSRCWIQYPIVWHQKITKTSHTPPSGRSNQVVVGNRHVMMSCCHGDRLIRVACYHRMYNHLTICNDHGNPRLICYLLKHLRQYTLLRHGWLPIYLLLVCRCGSRTNWICTTFCEKK